MEGRAFQESPEAEGNVNGKSGQEVERQSSILEGLVCQEEFELNLEYNGRHWKVLRGGVASSHLCLYKGHLPAAVPIGRKGSKDRNGEMRRLLQYPGKKLTESWNR